VKKVPCVGKVQEKKGDLGSPNSWGRRSNV
jgi:hypothetical protein